MPFEPRYCSVAVNVAVTAFRYSPAPSESRETDGSAAIPLASVTAVPSDLPFRTNAIVCPESGWPFDMSVADTEIFPP